MGLTDLQVKRFGPRERLYEEGDGKGLYLRVLPSGLKTWIFRYVFEGNRRRMVLGHYPVVSLAEARELHGKALADVERGVDPGAVAMEAKRARQAAP
ncbi:MAG: Arm DNA-binding domain-containing protein, partial [Acidobacteriota bacterium]